MPKNLFFFYLLILLYSKIDAYYLNTSAEEKMEFS